jgi:sporulation protein YlmC with PRC-barrel domain
MARTRRFLSTDTLEGNEVINQAGENLGKIETFMIDPEEGRVAYAVLSFGGFLGMGNKLFAVPMQALTLVPDKGKFLLNESKERLENAPGFDKDHWPDMADPVWGSSIYDYYGFDPYWDRSPKEDDLGQRSR